MRLRRERLTLGGDGLDDGSFSKFQSVTQTIFQMTHFKFLCGTYDPLWLISRLNPASYWSKHLLELNVLWPILI